MTQLHHRLLGVVLCRGPCNTLQTGTGILLSPNLVLTCAHVIFNNTYFKPYPEIYFYPRQYGQLMKPIKIEHYEYPNQYQDRKPGYKGYDYALLKLNQNVDEQEFIPLYGGTSEKDHFSKVLIYGYPQSKFQKEDGEPKQTKQYGLSRSGYILEIMEEARYILHRISTEKGQSGAPVLRQDANGKMTIIGLHVGHTEEKDHIRKFQEEHPDLRKINLTKMVCSGMIHRLEKFATLLEGEKIGVYEDHTSRLRKQQEENRQKQERIKILEKQIEDEKQIRRKIEKGIDINKTDPVRQKESRKNAIKSQIKGLIISGSQLKDLERLGRQARKSQYYNLQGDMLFSSGQYVKAIESYKKAVDIEPRNIDYICDLALALQHNFQHDQAIKCYRDALKINPKHDLGLNNLGIVLSKVGQWDEAVRSYLRAIEIDTEYDVVYINLKNAEWKKVSYEVLFEVLIFMRRIKYPDEDVKGIIDILEEEVEIRKQRQ